MKKSIIAMVALVSVVLVGCGGDPLDIWKVTSTKEPEKCSTDQSIKPDDKYIATLDNSTWEIYQGADKKYYLWYAKDGAGGSLTIEGTKDGKTYTFKSEVVDHDPPNWSETKRVITTTVNTYTFEVKGSTFTGTWDYSMGKSCTSTANNCQESDRKSCSFKRSIYGVKVDPDLEYDL